MGDVETQVDREKRGRLASGKHSNLDNNGNDSFSAPNSATVTNPTTLAISSAVSSTTNIPPTVNQPDSSLYNLDFHSRILMPLNYRLIEQSQKIIYEY